MRCRQPYASALVDYAARRTSRMARVSRKSLDVSTALTHLWLNSNKGTKRDMAISLIPFDRLDFRTLGYPKNGAPFSQPILGGRIPMLSRKLLVREVILAEQVEVLPGNRRAMATAVTLHEIRRLGEYGPVCCTKLGDSANELHLIRRPAILCTLRDFSWKK
jgi:hypothetical protein